MIVWTEDRNKWESFQHYLINGLGESKILVTTRKETVARMIESAYLIFIKELSKPECCRYLNNLLFSIDLV